MVTLLITTVDGFASNIEVSASGSSPSSNTSSLSFSYTPKVGEKSDVPASWEFHGSAAKSLAMSNLVDGEKLHSNINSGGVSYFSVNNFELVAGYEFEKFESDGVETDRPSLRIGQRFSVGSSAVREDHLGDDDPSNDTFQKMVGLFVGFEKAHSEQKPQTRGEKDLSYNQSKFVSSLNLELVRWLEVDLTYTKFNPETDISTIYDSATSSTYLKNRGSSFGTLLQNLTDEEFSVRTILNFTSETYLELELIKSRTAYQPAWFKIYSTRLTSVLFESWKYSLAVTDSSAEGRDSFSGALSLGYIF